MTLSLTLTLALALTLTCSFIEHCSPPPKSTVFCQSMAFGKGRLGAMSSYGVMST